MKLCKGGAWKDENGRGFFETPRFPSKTFRLTESDTKTLEGRYEEIYAVVNPDIERASLVYQDERET